MLKNNLNKLKQKYSGNAQQSIKSIHSYINNTNANSHINAYMNTGITMNTKTNNHNHRSNSASKINYSNHPYPHPNQQAKTQNDSKQKSKYKLLQNKFRSQKKLKMTAPSLQTYTYSYGDGFYNHNNNNQHSRVQKYDDDRGFVMRKLGIFQDRNVYTDNSQTIYKNSNNYHRNSAKINSGSQGVGIGIGVGERMTAPVFKVQKFGNSNNNNNKPLSVTQIGKNHQILTSYPSTTTQSNTAHAHTHTQFNYNYNHIKTTPKLQVMTKISPYFHKNSQQQRQSNKNIQPSNTNTNNSNNNNNTPVKNQNKNNQSQINSPKTMIKTAGNNTHRQVISQKQPVSSQPLPLCKPEPLSQNQHISILQTNQISQYQKQLLKSLKFNQLFFCCACLRYIFAIQKSYHYPQCSASLNLNNNNNSNSNSNSNSNNNNNNSNKLTNRQKYKIGVQRLKLLKQLAQYTKCKAGELRGIWDDVQDSRICRNYQKYINIYGNSNEDNIISRNYLHLNQIQTAAHIIIQKLMINNNSNQNINDISIKGSVIKQNGFLCGNA